MEKKFRPSKEQIETAKGIARKNNKSTVWVNGKGDKGEFFLEEDYARNSVGGDKDKYARLDFTNDGEVKEGQVHKITEEDIKKNPLLKAQGYKAGDEIQVLDPTEKEDAKIILDNNAEEVISAISTAEDPENPKALLEQEKTGKKRKTVITALKERIQELEGEGDTE